MSFLKRYHTITYLSIKDNNIENGSIAIQIYDVAVLCALAKQNEHCFRFVNSVRFVKNIRFRSEIPESGRMRYLFGGDLDDRRDDDLQIHPVEQIGK